jgi:acyl-CoA reductase-like NAD-dependent aldehyde dehydrogenase
MAERKEEFARTLAQEAGKPIKAARTEVERAIFTFNVAAEESTRIYGEYLPARLAGIRPPDAGALCAVSARSHRRHHAV